MQGKILPMPPTMTDCRKRTPSPNTLNCSAIWNANSRVGVRITAKIPKGSSDNFWRMGKANAAVLPLPVLALPMTLRPTMRKVEKAL
jgi:hypothetical protein